MTSGTSKPFPWNIILAVTAIIVIVAIMVFRSWPFSTGRVVKLTYPLSTNQVPAGNDSYPGFHAWQLQLEEDEQVELTVTASHPVTFLVLPDSAHQAWVNMSYHIQSPGLHYPADQALNSVAQVTFETLGFYVHSDGKYDLVALNAEPAAAAITFSGKVYEP